MWGKARRLAADLAFEKHRTTLLRQQLEDTSKERDSWKWTATQTISSHDDLVITRTRERDDARRLLATAEDDLAAARKRLSLSDRVKRSAAREAAGALGKADRYYLAWQSACRRARGYRAELADQQQVIDRQGVQLLDAFDYAPGDRQRLGLPAQEVTS